VSKLFNTERLTEEALKELYKLPELRRLSCNDRELFEEAVMTHAELLAEIPFLDGIALKNAENDLRHVKGVLMDIKALRAMSGRDAVIMAISSVLTRIIKIALRI